MNIKELNQMLDSEKKEDLQKTTEIPEGVYNATEAADICTSQMALREDILERIGDIEYNVKLLEDLYKLGFEDLDKDIVTGHIMQRVLIGTIINRNEEDDRKFVFGHIDTDIAEIFQKIMTELDAGTKAGVASELCKRKIRVIVDGYLKDADKLKTVH